jgi:hypothetical protein
MARAIRSCPYSQSSPTRKHPTPARVRCPPRLNSVEPAAITRRPCRDDLSALHSFGWMASATRWDQEVPGESSGQRAWQRHVRPARRRCLRSRRVSARLLSGSGRLPRRSRIPGLCGWPGPRPPAARGPAARSRATAAGARRAPQARFPVTGGPPGGARPRIGRPALAASRGRDARSWPSPPASCGPASPAGAPGSAASRLRARPTRRRVLRPPGPAGAAISAIRTGAEAPGGRLPPPGAWSWPG